MQPYQFTSHESFSHDSISSLGYDWERIADPNIAPKFPLKVYFPRSLEDVVAAARETSQLGQKLWVRSKGHSSNDLVLAEGGAVLCTELFNKVLKVDVNERTVKVQSGCVLAELDLQLRESGFGLPVIGDHNHITAGGFASVGGISPGSHRHGLFLDNVRALELVDWQGQVHAYDRTSSAEQMAQVLGGTGRKGVIATLTLDIVPGDKWKTITKNTRTLIFDLSKFVAFSHNAIVNAGDALFERGVWIEYPVFGRQIKVGQFSVYKTVGQSGYATLRDRFSYGYLHFLGYWAGRLPRLVDIAFKALGLLGIILSPRYASIKNIESFTDRVIDSSVGDPTRMLIVLAPMEKYQVLLNALHEICVRYRDDKGCFTFISFYVKGINSRWLSPEGKSFCELMLYLGIDPGKMTPALLSAIVSEIDALAIANGAFRYMHTKTSPDAALRMKLDPNERYRL